MIRLIAFLSRFSAQRAGGTKGARHLLTAVLKLAVSCGLIYYLATGMDWQRLREVFASTRLELFVAAVLLFVLSNCLGALQWFLLLRAQALTVSGRQALVFYFVGIFFNNVLLGNIGGDAIRILDIRRVTGESSSGVAATVVDRFVGLFTTCSLALLAYPLIAGVERAWLVSVLVPVWAGIVVVLAMGLSRRVGSCLERLAARVLPARGGELAASIRRSVGVYRERLPLLALVCLISVGVQFSRILVYYAAGRAVGLEAGLVPFVCFQPVAAIIAALPISVGGLGVREGTLVGLFGGLGVPRNLSFAMSLLGYVAGVVASLLGGIAFVVRRVEPNANANRPDEDDGRW